MANDPIEKEVDSLDELCAQNGVAVAPDQGILLVITEPTGGIHAHVLRLGILTEGRLEEAQMTLYNALIRARAKIHQEMAIRAYQERSGADVPTI